MPLRADARRFDADVWWRGSVVGASRTPRSDWAIAVANAFQVLVGTFLGVLPAERASAVFDRLAEPGDAAEHILVRCLLCEALVGAVCFGTSVDRREMLEVVLRAWPEMRRHPQPVAVLRQALTAQRDAVDDAENALAQHVRDVLEHRYAERLLLLNIADELKASQAKLSRCFRRRFGSTIHQHLIRVRVRHALNLVTRGVKIEAAGASVGFKSKKDFYRAVQRLVGCTPAEFRARAVTRIERRRSERRHMERRRG